MGKAPLLTKCHYYWSDANRRRVWENVVDIVGLDASDREATRHVYRFVTTGAYQGGTEMRINFPENTPIAVREAYRVLGYVEAHYSHVGRIDNFLQGAGTLLQWWSSEDEAETRLAPFLQMDDGDSLATDWANVGADIGRAMNRYAEESGPNVPTPSRQEER